MQPTKRTILSLLTFTLLLTPGCFVEQLGVAFKTLGEAIRYSLQHIRLEAEVKQVVTDVKTDKDGNPHSSFEFNVFATIQKQDGKYYFFHVGKEEGKSEEDQLRDINQAVKVKGLSFYKEPGCPEGEPNSYYPLPDVKASFFGCQTLECVSRTLPPGENEDPRRVGFPLPSEPLLDFLKRYGKKGQPLSASFRLDIDLDLEAIGFTEDQLNPIEPEKHMNQNTCVNLEITLSEKK